ncbi:ATP-dependent DNA ligase [Mycolicibacterium aromaticivorans JS19b1 = JCM 16368]|uniref:DNA ligase (ATP) n=1 Tax=Mycolicibacterium aromaticivorans JS19b1 = JCM 16368 TaxID=1440774 RepID=A0A064CJS3_9MYCO|nr:ATP-dependent DNA ligase [Mycolicibacterium aromaticivorans]KDE98988.1 ATP-dependent DNA ligase [Mycolicibacterium aromaticivorans JS19b1 = JCM 16368]
MVNDVWPPGATRGPRVVLTNADKVLYPSTGTTKADVFSYYTTIADVMLPHIAGRPVTRKRWPNGVGEPAFFEKQLASSAPGWLERATVDHRSGSTTYPIIETPTGLAWIAQQASLEVHVPQWRFTANGKIGPATRLVFDLDPGEGVTMPQLCEVANAVRELMDDIGLTVYPLTSGSKGLHLYAPLADPVSSSGAVVVARRVAEQLEKSMPKLVTATMTKSLRAGKIFLDWSQNNGSKTTIAPYSLRGRDTPTVAAPRTWDEIGDPALRHLEYHEVLARVAEQGDLLAGLDDDVPKHDRLTTYRSMRDATKTPEPVPKATPAVGQNNTFVIQEHHARRLHYDFRLEHDGVLVSWAVPKNLPDTPAVNRLAVHTEDHPLEYGTFEGDIPKGEYGGGKVIIWDSGTYDAEKFRDSGAEKGGEVIVDLHGQRISGRYALIQTKGDQWLAHRMKEQPTPRLQDYSPMLATLGSVEKLTAAEYAFEGKFDGYRLLVEISDGQLRAQSRSGRDLTADYPQLRSLAKDLADHDVILDGEVVALDADGVPNFGEMQNRVRATRIEFWAFDILRLDGRSLLKAKYRDRRKILETFAEGTDLIVPPLLDGDGPEALEFSRSKKWEGVVAKKWDSTYQPGRRSAAWIKDKNWNTQEAVIGGWREGNGGRSSGIGALLLGIPAEGGLRFIGRVGTGFSDKELTRLKKILAPLHTDESPFTAALSRMDAKGVTYVRPELVGEVRFGEWTSDGRLRHPSWRGLRPDKEPGDVELESPS